MARPSGAAVLVPVQINGRPAIDFVLDTGATLSCVDVSLARELQLPEDDAIGGIAVGAMNVGRLQTVRVDSHGSAMPWCTTCPPACSTSRLCAAASALRV